MNLGQTMLVLAAMVVLGTLVLNANRAMLESNSVLNSSEMTVAATTVAQSIVEEASGKLFDEEITDSTVSALSSISQLTTNLGPDGSERYRDTTGGHPIFDDFDDFDGLFVVVKSDQPGDAARTPGSDWEFIVPNCRDRFEIRSRVQYVRADDLDGSAVGPTWHKKLLVTITAASTKDTLVYPYIMSYWN